MLEFTKNHQFKHRVLRRTV